jgi:hypothetical protein
MKHKSDASAAVLRDSQGALCLLIAPWMPGLPDRRPCFRSGGMIAFKDPLFSGLLNRRHLQNREHTVFVMTEYKGYGISFS